MNQPVIGMIGSVRGRLATITRIADRSIGLIAVKSGRLTKHPYVDPVYLFRNKGFKLIGLQINRVQIAAKIFKIRTVYTKLHVVVKKTARMFVLRDQKRNNWDAVKLLPIPNAKCLISNILVLWKLS